MRSQQSAHSGTASENQVPTGPSKELRGWGSRDRKGEHRYLPSGPVCQALRTPDGSLPRGFILVGKAELGQTSTVNCLITTEGRATERGESCKGWDGVQGRQTL